MRLKSTNGAREKKGFLYMKVTLDKENRFLTKEGLLDIKRELIYAGTKAAWCFKDGTATPENIRNMPEIDLLRRGIETYINDHGTPDENIFRNN